MEVLPDDEMMLITKQGVIIRSSVAQVRNTGRNAQGVRLVNLDANDVVCSVARMIPEDKTETADARLGGDGDEPPDEGDEVGDGEA
jgi:DNA gyrase subunit A